MAKTDNWFAVDRKGMAQVLARRSKATAIYELISNAWDAPGTSQVNVVLQAISGKAAIELRITDDSTEGFLDLSEARTLFAPSKKKGNPELRGRFNLGEKLFLALCDSARITSTTGTISFQPDGTVKRTNDKTERGTEVYAVMRMTREELLEAEEDLRNIITPSGIRTSISIDHGRTSEVGLVSIDKHFNDDPPDVTFTATLPTEIESEGGELRPSRRKTWVHVWRHGTGGGWVYELGIPVVNIGGPFSMNLGQKVPLTIDRESLKPAFVRRLRTEVLNNAYALLDSKTEAEESWVTEAMSSQDPAPTREAMDAVMDLRFGRKRVVYDPNDREANAIAASKGYTVIPGGSLPRGAWDNVRSTATARPAGQVTPSNAAEFSSTGKDVSVDPSTVPGAPEVIALFERLARDLIGEHVSVGIVNDPRNYVGCYGDRQLLLNLRRLGRVWFQRVLDDGRLSLDHVELLLHELGHDYTENHLDERFHKSQTHLGAKLAFLAVANGIGADLFEVKR